MSLMWHIFKWHTSKIFFVDAWHPHCAIKPLRMQEWEVYQDLWASPLWFIYHAGGVRRLKNWVSALGSNKSHREDNGIWALYNNCSQPAPDLLLLLWWQEGIWLQRYWLQKRLCPFFTLASNLYPLASSHPSVPCLTSTRGGGSILTLNFSKVELYQRRVPI